MFRGAAPGQDRPAPTIQGMLIRYELKDDLYREFSPEWDRIEALVESKYSAASSVGLNKVSWSSNGSTRIRTGC
jgi:hypothetical protein